MRPSALLILVEMVALELGAAIASSVAAPAPTGAVTAYASQLTGGHAPCNLSTGLTATGVPCVDDTAALNAFLLSATANTPVHLIQDIGSSVTGVQFPAGGHVTIECSGWDAGFFIAAGSNAHGIRNVPAVNGYSGPGTPGTPGSNVEIRNCRINGNRGDGTTGNSTSGDARKAPNGNWLFGIYLDNLTHVRLIHNWIYDAPTFGILCNACKDAVFDGNKLDAPSRVINQDGIHVDGPSSQIRISNNWCGTPDDCIAMNAAEGYGGTIDGVAVMNSQCVDCLTAYRQLSNESGAATNAAVKNVTISNYAGTLADSYGVVGVALRLGEVYSGSKAPDVMQSVVASNLSFSSASANAYMIEVNDNLGVLEVNGLTWHSPRGANALMNFGNSTLGKSPATVSSVSLRGIHIMRTTAGNAGAYLLKVPSVDAIKTLHLDGIYVENQQGQSYSPIANLIAIEPGGAITNLDVAAIDPTNITALASPGDYGRIGRLYGAGLAATGFQVPDAIVPNLVPYISGTSPNAGNFCVKKSGTPACM